MLLRVLIISLFSGFLLVSQALADCTTPNDLKRVGSAYWRMGNVAFSSTPGVERLPSSVPNDIPQGIKDLGRMATGRTVHIQSDAAFLRLCWDNATGSSSTHKWTQNGMRGIDVYWKEASASEWKWLGQGNALDPDENIVEFDLGTSEDREFMIYMPSYARVLSLRVEVDQSATVFAGPKPSEKWVILGTSITQCANVSRPGLCYPAIMSREIGVDIANLGFSGSCKMYAGFEALLTQSNADAFIIDCLGNMNMTDIQTQMFDFLDNLASNNPSKEVWVMEQTHEYQGLSDKSVYDSETVAAKAIFDQAAAQHSNLHWVLAPVWTASDTSDGRHPHDGGSQKLAESHMSGMGY